MKTISIIKMCIRDSNIGVFYNEGRTCQEDCADIHRIFTFFSLTDTAPAGAGVNGRGWKVCKVGNPVFNFSAFQCRTEGDSPPSPPPKIRIRKGGCSGEKAQEKKKVPHSVTGVEGRMGYQAVL